MAWRQERIRETKRGAPCAHSLRGDRHVRRGWDGSSAAKIVFKAFDVIFTEILALLDFDKVQIVLARVGNAVYGPSRDINRVTGAQGQLVVIACDQSFASDDMPVFEATLMTL